jgi:hypothetical protein
MKPDYDKVGKGPWRSGPPPSVGWWPASLSKDKEVLRWWDGKHWGVLTWRAISADLAAHKATIRDDHQVSIKWRQRADWWPARSRT